MHPAQAIWKWRNKPAAASANRDVQRRACISLSQSGQGDRRLQHAQQIRLWRHSVQPSQPIRTCRCKPTAASANRDREKGSCSTLIQSGHGDTRLQQPQPIRMCRYKPASTSANRDRETQVCSSLSQSENGDMTLQLSQPIRPCRHEPAATAANWNREMQGCISLSQSGCRDTILQAPQPIGIGR